MMNLARAQEIALAVVSELAPFCEKIEIAGSVRRECNLVNDVDIVLIPKPGSQQKILAGCQRKMKLVTGGRRSDPNNVTFISDAHRPEDCWQLDLFFARGQVVDLVSTAPTNWGAVLLCRTGSQRHNVELSRLAHSKGLKFKPYVGIVKNDQILASATEEDIYEALGLAWIHPRERGTLPFPELMTT